MTDDHPVPSRPPDGIDDRHCVAPQRRLLAGAMAPLLLGAVVIVGLSGEAGGKGHRVIARSPDATLVVDAPQRLRNGEFFEAAFDLRANRDVEDMTLAIPTGFYRDVTINTMLPAPSEESEERGYYRFAFGALRAGDRIAFKIDGQVNPSRRGTTSGAFLLLDGDARLLGARMRLEVLP